MALKRRAARFRHRRIIPNVGRTGGRALRNTLATIRSKTGWRCEAR